jgi:FtsH-binding integral membrane protein
MRPSPADAGSLQQHMTGTYFALRLGMGALAAVLPVLLWLGSRFADREPLRCSMSAYYYSPAMRDIFVGTLVAIGVFLYLYKGFSRQENWALNLAGALAVGIAMVPTTPRCDDGAGPFTPHGTFAVLFFLSIAYVCLFRASDTLSLIRDTRRARRLRTVYRALGVSMVVSPAIAAGLAALLRSETRGSSALFLVEAFAVLTFAAYWITKSREMSATDAERLALERKLQPTSSPKPAGASSPGHIVQVEPE